MISIKKIGLSLIFFISFYAAYQLPVGSYVLQLLVENSFAIKYGNIEREEGTLTFNQVEWHLFDLVEGKKCSLEAASVELLYTFDWLKWQMNVKCILNQPKVQLFRPIDMEILKGFTLFKWHLVFAIQEGELYEGEATQQPLLVSGRFKNFSNFNLVLSSNKFSLKASRSRSEELLEIEAERTPLTLFRPLANLWAVQIHKGFLEGHYKYRNGIGIGQLRTQDSLVHFQEMDWDIPSFELNGNHFTLNQSVIVQAPKVNFEVALSELTGSLDVNQKAVEIQKGFFIGTHLGETFQSPFKGILSFKEIHFFNEGDAGVNLEILSKAPFSRYQFNLVNIHASEMQFLSSFFDRNLKIEKGALTLEGTADSEKGTFTLNELNLSDCAGILDQNAFNAKSLHAAFEADLIKSCYSLTASCKQVFLPKWHMFNWTGRFEIRENHLSTLDLNGSIGAVKTNIKFDFPKINFTLEAARQNEKPLIAIGKGEFIKGTDHLNGQIALNAWSSFPLEFDLTFHSLFSKNPIKRATVSLDRLHINLKEWFNLLKIPSTVEGMLLASVKADYHDLSCHLKTQLQGEISNSNYRIQFLDGDQSSELKWDLQEQAFKGIFCANELHFKAQQEHIDFFSPSIKLGFDNQSSRA